MGRHRETPDAVGWHPGSQSPREGLEVYAALDRISTPIAVGILWLDADAIAATLTLFFYIGSLGLSEECLHVRILHTSPLAVVIIICVHNNSGVAYGSTTPAPYA
jgi:hypothetical protein